jgi:hypothetical protein
MDRHGFSAVPVFASSPVMDTKVSRAAAAVPGPAGFFFPHPTNTRPPARNTAPGCMIFTASPAFRSHRRGSRNPLLFLRGCPRGFVTFFPKIAFCIMNFNDNEYKNQEDFAKQRRKTGWAGKLCRGRLVYWI